MFRSLSGLSEYFTGTVILYRLAVFVQRLKQDVLMRMYYVL